MTTRIRKSAIRALIIAAVAALTATSAYAQRQFFCELKSCANDFSYTKMDVVVDFGESDIFDGWGRLNSDLKMVDEGGKELKFNSIVDASNHLTSLGWTFVQAYSSLCNKRSFTNWIFTKQADSLEQAKAGILTKADFKKRK